MKYFLGVDGGATKTEAVIIDEQEKILGRAFGDSVNRHEIGVEQMKKNIEGTIKNALSQAKIDIDEVGFTVLGLAGKDTREDELTLTEIADLLMEGSLADKVKVLSDVEIAYKSCIDQDYGIVIIAGTGSNCFGQGKNEEVAWAGDWGYLLGDQGSGFALGLGALKRVMREFDGRGVATALTQMVLEKLALTDPLDLVGFAYQTPVPVKEIASLAPLVFSASEQGDKTAQDLVNKLIIEMVLSVQAVARKTNLTDEEFELGLVGGIFKENLVIKLLEREIKKILPKAKIVLPGIAPAMAAAKMAKEEINGTRD